MLLVRVRLPNEFDLVSPGVTRENFEYASGVLADGQGKFQLATQTVPFGPVTPVGGLLFDEFERLAGIIDGENFNPAIGFAHNSDRRHDGTPEARPGRPIAGRRFLPAMPQLPMLIHIEYLQLS